MVFDGISMSNYCMPEPACDDKNASFLVSIVWHVLFIDAVRIALNVTDVEAGILRELCERYQANFDEVLLLVFSM